MTEVELSAAKEFDLAVTAFKANRFDEATRICERLVRSKPEFPQALSLLAIIQMSLGKRELALANLDRLIAQQPNHAEAHVNRGIVLNALKRHEEAVVSFDRALKARPNYTKPHFYRAVTLHELKRYTEALVSYDLAIAGDPRNVELHVNRGVALHQLGFFEKALESYQRALEIRPNYAEALNNRGATLHALKRDNEAMASYNAAIAANPRYADAFNNRGNLFSDAKRFVEALADYDVAIAIRPDYADAMNNRGLVLNELRRPEEALESLDRALKMQPENPEIHNNRGVALHSLRRNEEALASYERALFLRPNHSKALNNRGIVLHSLKRDVDALASYDQALAVAPDYYDAMSNRAGLLEDMKRFDEALEGHTRALAAGQITPQSLSGAASCAMKLCEWDQRTRIDALLPEFIHEKKIAFSPYVLMGYSDDLRLHAECARRHFEMLVPQIPAPVWKGEIWHNKKIRIAYLAHDFRTHAMAAVMCELFEKHDRSQFEIVGVSFGPDDGSALRKRIIAAMDEFHDVRTMSDLEIARTLRVGRCDIAVDLQGYTAGQRIGIFAHRPVPVNVSYVAYPGTVGVSLMDYLIADKIVVPDEHQPFFSEKLVYLPDCYLPNDSKAPIASPKSRREAGLPERGFVFCCFNNDWKINPPVFDVWMQLLNSVEGSVLWLLRDNPGAERNLRREAQRRGIDPSRLVFADRVLGDEYRARYFLADLFLDTLPYNAHSTGTEALRAGLPLLTCKGQTFAARVAASQLLAIGIPELITTTLEDYRALALRLASQPLYLAEIKTKLARNRAISPLFDTERLTRHVESAYRTMWEISQRGELPRSFDVPA